MPESRATKIPPSLAPESNDDRSAAAAYLRWKADCMDPPGIGRFHVAGPNGTAMLETRQTHDDDNVAELYRHQADTFDRLLQLEKATAKQRIALYAIAGALVGLVLNLVILEWAR